MNLRLAVDQNVEAQLSEQRDRIETLLEEIADAYRVLAELEAMRDLRKSMGAKLSPVAASPEIVPLRQEKAG